MKFIIFGIGNYGSALAINLINLGHEVIGVDYKMEVAEKWKDHITTTIALDATSKEAMQTLPLKDVDAVVVAIGENPGITVMVTALLKQFGVNRIICRVLNPLQKTILETMNITEFTAPEEDSAERMAYKLDLKGVSEAHKITEHYQVIEVQIPERYIGTNLNEIDFIKEHNIQLITVVRLQEEKNIIGTTHNVKKVTGLDTKDLILQQTDSLLIFGDVNQLREFIEY